MSEFVRVGRGLYSTKDLAQAVAPAQDLEAQKPSAGQIESPPAQQPSEYAHSGRGGAGNWYSPKELQKQGTFASSDSTRWRAARPAGQNRTSVRLQGRGGAGNISQAAEGGEKGSDSEGVELETMVTDKVMQDVESALPPPQKAHLAQETLQDGTLPKAA